MLNKLVRFLTGPAGWLWRGGHRRTFVAYMAAVQLVARGAYLAGLR